MTDYTNWGKRDLKELASDLDIEGRSSMSKPQLIAAIQKAEGPDGPPSEPERSVDSVKSKPAALSAKEELAAARAEIKAAKHAHRAAVSRTLQSGIDCTPPAIERLNAAKARYVAAGGNP